MLVISSWQLHYMKFSRNFHFLLQYFVTICFGSFYFILLLNISVFPFFKNFFGYELFPSNPYQYLKINVIYVIHQTGYI